jgi:ADP-ribose pyrophosphatase YjhB (NUDIX family)
LAIIFNPKYKKIIIGKRVNDPEIKELSWCFPGGRPIPGKDIQESLNQKIKLKTGYDVENLGAIFSKIYPEKKDLMGVYYLCEVTGGKPIPGDDIKEIKWVSPEEIEKYFTTSFHPILKEYIMNLK